MFGSLDDGSLVRSVINQGIRFCEVIERKPTRVRIEYEMPSGVLLKGWLRSIVIPNGERYLKSKPKKDFQYMRE